MKVFEIQLMRDHIFHLPSHSALLSIPPSSVLPLSLWRKVSIMNMDRHAILVRESCGCGDHGGGEGEAEMEAGLKRREGRAERQRSKVGQVILAAKSGMAGRTGPCIQT